MGLMADESGTAAAQLQRLTTQRDNLAALVARLSVLDSLMAGTAALNLLLEVHPQPCRICPSLLPSFCIYMLCFKRCCYVMHTRVHCAICIRMHLLQLSYICFLDKSPQLLPSNRASDRV